MNYKLILVLAFAPCFANAQSDYKSKIWQADVAYEEQDYRKSLAYYNQAFDIKDDEPIDLYNAACNYALIKDKKMALKYLTKAMKLGFSNYHHLYNDKDLYVLRHESKWKKLMRKYEVYDRLQIADN